MKKRGRMKKVVEHPTNEQPPRNNETHSKEAMTILTIGHSTRTLSEFLSILKAYNVTLVVDVRTVPRSRHNPQFNKENLPESLKTEGVRYIHLPELGGFRRPRNDSENIAWRNKSFQGYADYMQTKEFIDSLLKLLAFARENRLVLMCAEAMPWRCHRSLIADALTVRDVKVEHILTSESHIKHELSPSAHVEGTKITYPLFAKEKLQRTLADFAASIRP
jgi:uncharacterized protein (DUF488 family)